MADEPPGHLAADPGRRGPDPVRVGAASSAGTCPATTAKVAPGPGGGDPAASDRPSTACAGKRAHTRSMVSCMAMTKKVTVTIPEDLLDEIRAEAAERGLSAYVAEALRFKRDRDRLRELADWLQEEHGPLTEEERTAAFEELDKLDAEHERRRAAGNHNAGEAA